MTTTVKVHVNGNYRATVIHKVDGEVQSTTEVNGGEEKQVHFVHGRDNVFEISEVPVAADDGGEAKGSEAG